jgi:hypothetical protein
VTWVAGAGRSYRDALSPPFSPFLFRARQRPASEQKVETGSSALIPVTQGNRPR